MEAIEKINKQIELELTASSVYRKLKEACDCKEVGSLWQTLATHEEYHAAALKRLKATLSYEELEKEASTLDIDNINSLLAGHKRYLDEISYGISVTRAFQIAMDMEFSELNSLFFNHMGKGGEDPSPYIHSMGAGTKSHLMTLYKGIEKHAGPEEQAPYREKFVELGLI